jgi:hypothetical protein
LAHVAEKTSRPQKADLRVGALAMLSEVGKAEAHGKHKIADGNKISPNPKSFKGGLVAGEFFRRRGRL